MVNNQNEVTLQSLYDLILKIDGTLNNKMDSSVETLKAYIDQENNDLAVMISNSFTGFEQRMDKRFVRIEARLDKIELSTPRELEKRIMVVEEDSDSHNTYFRGFRKTLEVV